MDVPLKISVRHFGNKKDWHAQGQASSDLKIQALEKKIQELQNEIKEKDKKIAFLTKQNKANVIKNDKLNDEKSNGLKNLTKAADENSSTSDGLKKLTEAAIKNSPKSNKQSSIASKSKNNNFKKSFTNETSLNIKESNSSDSDSDWGELDGTKDNNLTDQGKEIKRILQENEMEKLTKTLSKTKKILKTTTPHSSSTSNKPTNGMNIYREEYSGIRIINPKVSYDEMRRMMEGKDYVKLLNIQSSLKDSPNDWVTMGVIVNKMNGLTSRNGNKYGKWFMSDLSNCQKFVSFMLFSKTLEEHWKISQGSVIALLNPKIMESSEKFKGDGTTLTIDNPKNLLLMGSSKDFGICKSTTAKGAKCSNVVNKLVCEVCEFHLNKAHKQSLQKRPDLNTSYSGVGVPKKFNMYKDAKMVFYGGESYTPNRSAKKRKITLESVIEHKRKVGSEVPLFAKNDPVPEKKIDKMSPASDCVEKGKLKDLLLIPSPGARNLLAQLKKESGYEEKEEESLNSKAASPVKNMKASEILNLVHQNKTRKFTYSPIKSSPQKTRVFPTQKSGDGPQLGRGLGQWDEVNLDLSPEADNSTKQNKKAIGKIRLFGGIEKEDPNCIRPKITDEKKKLIREKVNKDMGIDDVGKDDKNTPKRKLIGGLDLNDPKVRALIDKQSAYSGALAEEDADKMNSYFGQLEKRDEIENKMASTFSVECKVVSCSQCGYSRVSKPGKICKDERHDLKWSKAERRFFKCKECGNRTTSVERIPTKQCDKCGSLNFERTSMLIERKLPQLPSEELHLTTEKEGF
ncbi:DgyrCDS11245 [Dimorphilus gyrociliatus]|uniref:Protein MCM10 homolog n=1 Tax=Dimorphilus gyrociliatus TaxID=2664684 RepID=A0A7I8W2Q9_9ANNE|nr:DgyrCDS11245 [Dimorphilus gyrociliatus]